MKDEIKEILKEIKSYENEDMCIIILTQEENKALLGYIKSLELKCKDLEKINKELKEGETNEK